MASQTGKNVYVSFLTEGGAFNSGPARAGAAEKIRINPSPGLNLTRATILPGEIRSDLQTQMGRLGSRTVAGSYNCDLSINSFDSILEAIFRSTETAAVAITQATMTSITTTASTIVATEGNWITQGVRVGDIVRLTDNVEAANNDINLTVKSIYADRMTGIGTLAIDADPVKFKTTTTAAYTINNIDYTKVATTALVFSGVSTINTVGAAGTNHWGSFLVQINAAETVSTKPGEYTGGTDQDYASEALALDKLAIPDPDNIQLGYIMVQGKANTAWVEATNNLTAGGECETSTFYDTATPWLARTITVVGTPLTIAVADTTFTLTILKKLMNATVPSRRSFYIDEYNQDIDMSEVYGGCRFSGFTIRGTPDGMATIEIRVVGASQTARALGADSPYFTAATLRTDIGLVFVDASIVRDGTTVLSTCTSFELNCDLNAQALPVIGATVTPDVFDNEMTISGSLSMLREDLAYITALGAETEYSLQLLLVEPDATDPIDCLNLYLPRIKFTGVDTPLGQDGGWFRHAPSWLG